MVLPKGAVSKLCEKMSRKTCKGEQVEYNGETDCPVPYISCVCKGVPLPTSVDGPLAGVRMRCKNDRCHLAKLLVHKKCFEQLEETLLKILSNVGSARGWTDAQLRQNIWAKKGQTLIAKLLRCHCGQGMMCFDVEFYQKREKEEQEQAAAIDAKQQKKKPVKKNKLPSLNFNNVGPVALELLQNDFLPVASSRRFSQGHTSQSASALIFDNNDPHSDSEIDEHRNSIPPAKPIKPAKKSLFHLKPKSDHELPPMRMPPVGRHLFRQRRESGRRGRRPLNSLMMNSSSGGGSSSNKSSPDSQQQLQQQKPIVKLAPRAAVWTRFQQKPSESVENNGVGGTDMPFADRLRQRTTPQPVATDREQQASGPKTLGGCGQVYGGQSSLLTTTASQQQPIPERAPASEPQKVQSGNFYSLFDNRQHGFYLGESLLGETHFPGLMQLPRLFSRSL